MNGRLFSQMSIVFTLTPSLNAAGTAAIPATVSALAVLAFGSVVLLDIPTADPHAANRQSIDAGISGQSKVDFLPRAAAAILHLPRSSINPTASLSSWPA